ncbi:MAG: GNAT family N-acetyltransferase [Bdellovibrionaceae bacterium]|jgi:aralkylamine N-acetyltransferase|nr:GNAT family N-acetyltransferase [Pseudobdellovibrionaceae bacterium]
MNGFKINYGVDGLDWDEVDQLFTKAPLGARSASMFQEACKYSPVIVSAWDGNKLIGFGRAFTDFFAYAAIYDIAVLPEYQNQGVGRALMESIINRVEKCGYITLFVAPGRENFYEKLGFKKLKSGMAKIKNEEHAISRGHI